jgi:hypothetical protein
MNLNDLLPSSPLMILPHSFDLSYPPLTDAPQSSPKTLISIGMAPAFANIYSEDFNSIIFYFKHIMVIMIIV